MGRLIGPRALAGSRDSFEGPTSRSHLSVTILQVTKIHLWNNLSKFALRHADHYIVHSRQNASDLLRLFPSANIFVHPHPVPRSLPSPKNIFRRRSLTELLFFGFVRPYKGLDVLLNALVHLKDFDFYLTVAGEFWNASNEARDFVERHGLDGRVEIVARYVSDWEAAEYFARADAVVLPYIRATSSGVIPLAYYYDKPVIASRVGGLPDFVEEGGTGLLVHPGSPTDLARALSTIISNGGWYNINSITKMKQKLSWQSFVRAPWKMPSNSQEDVSKWSH